MIKTYIKDTLTREVLNQGVKLRVIDADHSRAFQEALFDLGCGWYSGGKTVQYTNHPFLCARGYLWRWVGEDEFRSVDFQEIYFDDGRDSLTFIDLFVVAVETWTKYIAMDSDGVVYGYDEKPRSGDHRWFGDGSNYIYLGTVDVGGLDWKNTLLEVGASGARRTALDLEKIRKRGQSCAEVGPEEPPAFDLAAALDDAPVKLRSGGKAYLRYFESEYEVDYPIIGLIEEDITSVTSWRENGKHIGSMDSPNDIVGMWLEQKED